jgi:predicted acetyltransferase
LDPRYRNLFESQRFCDCCVEKVFDFGDVMTKSQTPRMFASSRFNPTVRLLTRPRPLDYTLTIMKPPLFSFIDAPRVLSLIDHELELVEPDIRQIDDVLAACHHPITKRDMPSQAQTTRDTLITFLTQNPLGRTAPDSARGIVPGYTFWMRFRTGPAAPSQLPDIAIAGSISLRIGHNPNLDLYLGHIGYHVLPPARGRRYAERACRLLLPLARAHGHKSLWITCNPDNIGSRKTCERLGAQFIDTVPVPKNNPLYSQGDREKCRYRLDL